MCRRNAIPNAPSVLMRAILVLLLPFAVQSLGCTIAGLGEGSTSDADATITAMQATINAQAATATSASAATATPQPTSTPTFEPPPTLEPTLETSPNPPGDLEQLIRSSRILLFEDVAGNPDIHRYVQAALERLGFREGSYVDVGDALGRFMDHLRGNAPDGQPWDLIIIASEDRGEVQGTFYEILEGILDSGKTSVILETWNLDQISEGAVKPILLRCGVYPAPWFRSGSAGLKVYALKPDHPLLTEVIGVRDFRVSFYWILEVDQGDLLFLTGTGDAQLVVGTNPQEPNGYGTLAECFNSRLILQTMSSHNYTNDTSVPLWMNYIHYALRRHYGY